MYSTQLVVVIGVW